MSIKDKYSDIFLVERGVEYQKIKKITVFFLLSLQKDITMTDFMKTHKISKKALKEKPNLIMDFYNDLIKFQNDEKSYLNHLTIFNNLDENIVKYLENAEENENFIKWITIKDKKWLKKIYKYFLTKEWFKNSDNN